MTFGEDGSIAKPSRYAQSLTQEQRDKINDLGKDDARGRRELRQQLRDENRRARLSERSKNESSEAGLRESSNRALSEKKTKRDASDNEDTKGLTKIQSETVVGQTSTKTFTESQKTPTFTNAESRSSTLQSVLLQVCHNGRPALFQFYGGLVDYLD